MGVVEAYLDESGIHNGAKVCVFAGYVGGYRQFRMLGKQWEPIVSRLPNSDFHAKEFFGRDSDGERIGPYKGWTDMEATAFLDSLIDEIHAVSIHPRGAMTNVAAFTKRDLEERIFLTGGTYSPDEWLTRGSPNSPYYLSYNACLTECVRYADKDHPLNVFCDQQKQLSGHASEMWLIFQRLNPHFTDRCGPLVFDSRLKIKLLQAADLLAFTFYKQQTNPNKEISYAMNRLLEKERKLLDYDERGITLALETFQRPAKPADPRSYIAAN